MDSTITSLYAQLFGIGLLWVTFHCAGMCGPLIAGLSSGAPTGGSRRRQLARRAGGVLAYQAGRGLVYAALGAAAGWLGSTLESSVHAVTRIAGLVVALALVGAGLYKLVAQLRRGEATATAASSNAATSGGIGAKLGAAVRRIGRLGPRNHYGRMALFGVVLGLLPCMLMFWALGLSASSASPLHGAGLMLGLVALTTPVLLSAGCASMLGTPLLRRIGAYAVPVAMILSGAWLAMISAAANGWIEHLHLPFTAFGEKLVIMLW
jgi:hypothetical protein